MIAIFSTLPGLYFAALLASVGGHVCTIAATPDRAIVRVPAELVARATALDVESTERAA